MYLQGNVELVTDIKPQLFRDSTESSFFVTSKKLN
jgi:hypothetical protein